MHQSTNQNSLPPSRLRDLTVTQAAKLLAKRASVVCHEKQAAGPIDWLKGQWSGVQDRIGHAAGAGGVNAALDRAGQWWNKYPAIGYGAAGAGLGGLIGAGSSLMSDDEDSSPTRSGVTGALAGAALGGGLGALKHHYGQIQKPSDLAGVQKAVGDLDSRIGSPIGGVASRMFSGTEDLPGAPGIDGKKDLPGLPGTGPTLFHPATIGTALGVAGWDASKLGVRPNNIADPEIFRMGLNNPPASKGLNNPLLAELAKSDPSVRGAVIHAVQTGGIKPGSAQHNVLANHIAKLRHDGNVPLADSLNAELHRTAAGHGFAGITSESMKDFMRAGLSHEAGLPKGQFSQFPHLRPTFFQRDSWKPNWRGLNPFMSQTSVTAAPMPLRKTRAVGRYALPFAVAALLGTKGRSNDQAARDPRIKFYLDQAAQQQAR